LLSENGDVHAEFELENKYPGILRFILVHPLANPCMLSGFFVFSSKDMNDEGLNCTCLVGHNNMTTPGLWSLRFEGESRARRSRCFSGSHEKVQ